MGGHEPRDPDRENVAYGPWAAWRKDASGSHRRAAADQHAAVSSANAMDCENAPAPSFVRTQSPPAASSLPDHGTASLLVEAHPSPSESHRDNLFLEGDADPQPVPSPESRPPGDNPPGEHGLVAPLGASSWSASAAAHRPDPAKFTRAPDSVARRLLPIRPPHVSARLAFSGAAASAGIAIIAFIASVGAPGWLPLIGVSGNGPPTLSHRASTGYSSSIPSAESTTGLDPRRPNPHLTAALRPTPKSTSGRSAHRRPSHATLFVGRRAASSARYVASHSPHAASWSAPASQSTSTPASSRSYTPPATTTPAVAPSTYSSPSAPSTSSSQTASARPKQAGPTGPVSLIGAGTSPSS
jgi:hypothetical protein